MSKEIVVIGGMNFIRYRSGKPTNPNFTYYSYYLAPVEETKPMPKSIPYENYLHKNLQEDEEVVSYLKAALEDGDINVILLAARDVTNARLKKIPIVLVSAVEGMLDTVMDNFKDWETRSPDELRMKVGTTLRYTSEFRKLLKSRMETIKKDENT